MEDHYDHPCAPAGSQVLPVKPQGVWARGIEAWAGSRDRPNLEFRRWGSSGPSSVMLPCCDSVVQFSKVQVHNVGKYGRNTWAKWYWKGGCKLQVQNRVGALAASAMMPGIQILYCPDKAGCTYSFAWALYVFSQFWLTIHCVSVASVFTTCYTHWNVFFFLNLRILKLKVKLNQTIFPNLNIMGLIHITVYKNIAHYKFGVLHKLHFDSHVCSVILYVATLWLSDVVSY